MSTPPASLVICNSEKDRAYVEELLIHLAVLRRQNILDAWHPGCVAPGENRSRAIREHTELADVVVLAVSPDLLAEDGFWQDHFPQLLEGHYRGTTHLVPLLLRHSHWRSTELQNLRPLPSTAVPVSNSPDRDATWAEIVQEIASLITKRRRHSSPSADVATLQEQIDRLLRAEDALRERCARLESQLEEIASENAHTPGERFRFRCAVARSRILSPTDHLLEVYHEVVALKRCRVFQHRIGSIGENDFREVPPIEDLQYRIEKRLGESHLQVQLRPGHRAQGTQEYFVDVIPELKPKQELGYWRQFRLPNHYPLTREALRKQLRASHSQPLFGADVHADNWDVVYDIDRITTAIHFPLSTNILYRGVRVLDSRTREENAEEMERCSRFASIQDSPATSERILEFTVQKPLIYHSYYVLYEPLD